MTTVELHLGDCLEVMPTLTAGSVQMVFADLPYGCTRNKWDSVIDLQSFWRAIHATSSPPLTLLTATQPFAAKVVASNLTNFRYDLIWEKSLATGWLNAKKQPLRAHESILVFYAQQPTFHAQKKPYVGPAKQVKSGRHSSNYGKYQAGTWQCDGTRMPRSVLQFPSRDYAGGKNRTFHPTQKPLALLEYLIRTYTNEGDTVLDPVMGSGTTAIACLNTGRHFVGIEKDAAYFAAAKQRIDKHKETLRN